MIVPVTAWPIVIGPAAVGGDPETVVGAPAATRPASDSAKDASPVDAHVEDAVVQPRLCLDAEGPADCLGVRPRGRIERRDGRGRRGKSRSVKVAVLSPGW